MNRGVGGVAVGTERGLITPDDPGRAAVLCEIGLQMEFPPGGPQQCEAGARVTAEHESAVAKRFGPGPHGQADRAEIRFAFARGEQDLKLAVAIDKAGERLSPDAHPLVHHRLGMPGRAVLEQMPCFRSMGFFDLGPIDCLEIAIQRHRGIGRVDVAVVDHHRERLGGVREEPIARRRSAPFSDRTMPRPDRRRSSPSGPKRSNRSSRPAPARANRACDG